MKNFRIYTTAILLFAFNNISSQDFAKKGIWELGGTISFMNTTSVYNGKTYGNSLNTLSIKIPVYYFIVDKLELGLVPGLQNISGGGMSASLIELLAGIAYNFQTKSNAYPFFEGQLGFNSSSNGVSESGVIWSLNAGTKIQIGTKALARIGLFYEQRTLETSSNEGGRNGTNSWGLNAGFAIFY